MYTLTGAKEIPFLLSGEYEGKIFNDQGVLQKVEERKIVEVHLFSFADWKGKEIQDYVTLTYKLSRKTMWLSHACAGRSQISSGKTTELAKLENGFCADWKLCWKKIEYS